MCNSFGIGIDCSKVICIESSCDFVWLDVDVIIVSSVHVQRYPYITPVKFVCNIPISALIYMLNSSGLNTDPCNNPLYTVKDGDVIPSYNIQHCVNEYI